MSAKKTASKKTAAKKSKAAAPTKAKKGAAKAVAAADQENARLRDEREASADGLTASERAMTKASKKKESACPAGGKHDWQSDDDGNQACAKCHEPAPKGKRAKAVKEPKEKKMSALDAAAKLLTETGEAMNCKQMIEGIAAKGYWTSPGGKTPSATLYSAILRELATKGHDARFVKTERGMFQAAK